VPVLSYSTIEKTPRKFQFGKKSAKIYHSLYSSTGQLQVALWTFMFIRLGLNKEMSLNTLPLQCPSPISPSLIPPSRNPPSRTLVMGSLMRKTIRMIVDNIFLGFQKSETKSRGVLHFVPLRRFYDVLFVPLFCLPRDKCGTLWKTTWLHNVDNIRQKDIKVVHDIVYINLPTPTMGSTIYDNLYFSLILSGVKVRQNYSS
jgi:hypothetical protein